ncbi:DUF3426 domain-containing protein [Zoogloea dura]|uniref:DUF3426 domain-containing protein n=1 Tax=Zoogloea dura TaxID=2728840 RepID=A0A848G3W2_9RHOO|nr:DUF3426 domain-containing protein [Zoogloea dura]NML25899.1 DUF3426 domain-containing protein [Zoogloea dura]
MILARCPACATTFRVRPEQLRARQGRVRCGQCNHAFNALETLVDENAVPIPLPPALSIAHEVDEVHEPQLQPAPQPSPDTPLFVLEDKEPGPSSLDTEGPVEPVEPAATPLADDTAEAAAYVLEEAPHVREEPLEAAADEPIIDEAAHEAVDAQTTEPLPPTDPDLSDEPGFLLPADEPADIPQDTAAEALPPAHDVPADSDEPDAPPVDIDDWPAVAAAPAPGPDARIEPNGEIALPPADEWPPAEDEALIEAPPDAQFDDTQFDDAPEQAATAPATAAPDSLASDPLLEFGMDDDFPSAAPSAPAPPHFQADWPDPADLDLKASTQTVAPASAPVIDFDALLHKEDAGEPAAGLVAESAAESVAKSATREADIPPPAPLLEQPEPRHEPSLPAAQDKDEDEDTGEDEQDDEPPPPSSLNQALWAAGATLLSLALLAQGVLVFRNEIALSSPPTRPALEALCNSLGCDLPLPREAAEIAIESSDIQPDASREAFFTLHATLRNRAEFQQAWPHLEVTLTDARDKALVRRVLEPAQWLPADAPKDAFPARREIATRVAFEAPGVAAAGYRVYAFYP